MIYFSPQIFLECFHYDIQENLPRTELDLSFSLSLFIFKSKRNFFFLSLSSRKLC
jgi:hypothetical protein